MSADTTTIPIEKVVAQHAESVRNATAARDRAIVAMHAKGASGRQIARSAGLSHTAIQQILKRAAMTTTIMQ